MLNAGKVDTTRADLNPVMLRHLQRFIDQASPNLGAAFTPTYAAYAFEVYGLLTLVGGQFIVEAGDDRHDYARQQLQAQIAALEARGWHSMTRSGTKGDAASCTLVLDLAPEADALSCRSR